MLDNERFGWCALVLVSYGLLCLWARWQYKRSFSRQMSGKETSEAESRHGTFLIAYASQSGTASQLAKCCAAKLEGIMSYQILPLNQVNSEILSNTQQALFVVSTFGEGKAPDNGAGFARRYFERQSDVDLSHLHFSVMALGDRLYQQFCAFGHQVYQGLCLLGAKPLFATIEACASESERYENVVQDWARQLKLAQNNAPKSNKQPDSFHPCLFTQRTLLNPDSLGAGAYHLCFKPQNEALNSWQAGDLVEIKIHSEQSQTRSHGKQSTIHQAKRKYSIASIAQEGQIELLVRQLILDDGSLGLGSGWLTQDLTLNSSVEMRLCDNPGFHAVEAQRPLILIGSGTGLAGLRAHLKQREQQGARNNWLIFGERTAQHDNFFNDEIAKYQASGLLTQVDLAFSRDKYAQSYVQDCLFAKADELQQWLDLGAAIYVCGKKSGMANSVDDALKFILAERYDDLIEHGLYRRDVY